MAADIVIRPCRIEECPNVLDVWRKADATPGVTNSLQELKTLTQTYGDLFLVAERNDELIGTRLRKKGAKRLSVLIEREHTLAVAFWDSLSDWNYKPDQRIVRYIKTL
ncbi:hypothetical protein ACFLUJ_05795 [Chloroflexota bacterium]